MLLLLTERRWRHTQQLALAIIHCINDATTHNSPLHQWFLVPNPITFAAIILGSWKELLLLVTGRRWGGTQYPALANTHCNTDAAMTLIHSNDDPACSMSRNRFISQPGTVVMWWSLGKLWCEITRSGIYYTTILLYPIPRPHIYTAQTH